MQENFIPAFDCAALGAGLLALAAICAAAAVLYFAAKMFSDDDQEGEKP